MFKNGVDTVIPEPIPSRVYAVCQYIKKHRGQKQDIMHAVCMDDVFTASDNSDIFNHSLNAAVELGLVKGVDNEYSAEEALLGINSMVDFRRYAANEIFKRPESLIFKITSLYCEYAEEMLQYTKWEQVVESLGNHGLQFPYNTILGWRFWVPFLGCGYLNDTVMLPNWYVRFDDLLATQKEFKPGQMVPIKDFVEWIEAKCPEVRKSRKETQLGLGVSNGLRTLEAMGKVKLERQPDSLQWQLYRFEGSNDISHVTIAR